MNINFWYTLAHEVNFLYQSKIWFSIHKCFKHCCFHCSPDFNSLNGWIQRNSNKPTTATSKGLGLGANFYHGLCLKGWSCGHPVGGSLTSHKETRTNTSALVCKWSWVVDCLMTVLWLSHGYLMTVSWLSQDCLMTVSWLSHGFIMTVSWLFHDCLMTVSRMSHDCLMTVSWLSHD